MSVYSVAFRCDRDGAETSGREENPAMIPDGWVTASFGGSGMQPAQVHLCPHCAGELGVFMSAGGLAFAFKPVPKFEAPQVDPPAKAK